MLKEQAINFVGTLSNTSKMPGKSISLPAQECKTGSKLRKVKGSVCEKCYAMKGCYSWGNVQKALYNRLDKVNNTSSSDWVSGMVKLINKQKYFRWHDSGDIQSIQHLDNICKVVLLTPNTLHWLPTKEVKMVRDYLKSNEIPDNLNIRVSSPMIDQKPIKMHKSVNTSTVHTDKSYGFECPAGGQGGACLDCRSCWNKDIKNVSYKLH